MVTLILAATLGLLALTAFVRWSVLPVLATFRIAYLFGRTMERLCADPSRFTTVAKMFYRFGRGDRSRR